MSNSKNHCEIPTSAIGMLHAFCSADSLFKADEQLRNSFNCFPVRNHQSSVKPHNKRLQKDCRTLEELLPIRDELAEELIAKRDRHNGKEISQVDFGNQLYASLKRHPE